MTDRPLISLVISTIGRPEELRRLLGSIPSSAARTLVEVVVVDQSSDQGSQTVCEQAWSFPVRHLASSGKGASLGRNEGMTVARGSVVAFPDDDCWYSPGLLDGVADLFCERSHISVISAQQVAPDLRPSMIPFPQNSKKITRLNVIRCAIESSVFMSAALFRGLGGFDVGLGTGSAGWWGAGEITDLLLRAIATGACLDYEPELHVFQEDIRPAASPSFRRKMLLYGCGMGEVLRRHNFPRWYLGSRIGRRVVRIGLERARGRRDEATASAVWLRGLVSGWRGVPPHELAGLVQP